MSIQTLMNIVIAEDKNEAIRLHLVDQSKQPTDAQIIADFLKKCEPI